MIDVCPHIYIYTLSLRIVPTGRAVVSTSIMILMSDPICRGAYETSKVARVTWLEALRMLSGGVILLREERT